MLNDLAPAIDRLSAIEPWTGVPADGAFPNFLGVQTAWEFVEKHAPSNVQLNARGTGQPVETAVPQVSDGEAFFEFASIEAAVTAAREKFIMVELGGGFGARTVDAHVALQRLNPLPSQYVVVEAEPTHFEWVKQHMQSNGIDPAEHWLLNAFVSDNANPLLFMIGSGLYYNTAVTAQDIDSIVQQVEEMGASSTVLGNVLRSGRCGLRETYSSDAGHHQFEFGFVSAVTLPDILGPLPHVDLMDVDVQGAETTIFLPALEQIDRKVHRMHIGTHGAPIHDLLVDLFEKMGWVCQYSYAGRSEHQTRWGDFKTSDGILHVVNPRFCT